MPNWKKVAVSGSAASFSSLSIDTSITASIVSSSQFTGSLFGTASYALTASYVEGVSSFPYTGSAVISGSLDITGSTSITGSFNLTGNSSTTGSSNITGSSIITGSIGITGSLNLIGDNSITGSSNITGSFNLTGNNSITGSSNITGSSIITGSISITGSFNLTGNNSTTGSVDITGSFNLTGNNSTTGSSNITGSTTVTGSTFITGSFNLVGNSSTTGSVDTTGSFNLVGNSSTTGSVAITGSLTVTGSLSISGSVSTDGGVHATYFSGSIIPQGPLFIADTSNAISFLSTASLYTDGGARITKDLYVSGTTYLNNLTVFGSASIQYVTSSTFIGLEFINLNTDLPALRYAGINVGDSGSAAGVSSSFWYDSEKDNWLYVYAPAGSSQQTSSLSINGPITYNNVGNEQGLTANYITKGQLVAGDNNHHITSSQIYDDGTTVAIAGNLQVTGSISAANVTVTSNLRANNIVTDSGDVYIGPFADVVLSGDSGYTRVVNNDLQVTGSLKVTQGITGSLFGTASNAVSSSYALTSSYLNPVTSGYVVLTQVSQSLNFADDAAAAANGVPLGGLYRNGNFILIRIS